MSDSSTLMKKEVGKRIKRVRVYIIHDRKQVMNREEQIRVDNLNKPQNRIKTIKSFGKSIGDRDEDKLYFRKWSRNTNNQLVQDQNDTHVVDHMKTVFGQDQCFDEDLKAVNVGTDEDPVWYPQEFLQILPYQMYNNPLPDKLVAPMLKLACLAPANLRARIESKGLRGLGVNRHTGPQSFVSLLTLKSPQQYLTSL